MASCRRLLTTLGGRVKSRESSPTFGVHLTRLPSIQRVLNVCPNRCFPIISGAENNKPPVREAWQSSTTSEHLDRLARVRAAEPNAATSKGDFCRIDGFRKTMFPCRGIHAQVFFMHHAGHKMHGSTTRSDLGKEKLPITRTLLH